MLRDGSNRLYFVGQDGSGNLTIVRTNLDGAVDTSYGAGGAVTVASVSPADAQVTQAGTMYATGSADLAGTPTATVVRVTSAGALDTGFGTGGLARFPRAGASTAVNAIGFAPGGRFVLGITAQSLSTPSQVTEYLVRAAAVTGTPDPGFGSAGWYHTVERNVFIMTDSSGRLIVAGVRPDTGRGIVVRRLS
jgi:hypothetical protein